MGRDLVLASSSRISRLDSALIVIFPTSKSGRLRGPAPTWTGAVAREATGVVVFFSLALLTSSKNDDHTGPPVGAYGADYHDGRRRSSPGSFRRLQNDTAAKVETLRTTRRISLRIMA